MRNWRQSRILGGITLALVLGDIGGIYLVKHKLASKPEMPTLYVESASAAVAKAAQNFHHDVLEPSRSALALVQSENPAKADVFAVAESRAVPVAEVIKESPASSEVTSTVKFDTQPIVRKQETSPIRVAVARPIRHTQVTFASAFARELAVGRAANARRSSAAMSREYPQPIAFQQSAVAQQTSVNEITATVADGFPVPQLSAVESQNNAPVAGESVATGENISTQGETQPSPAPAPVPSSVDAELPAL